MRELLSEPITVKNMSNMLCEYSIHISDIINDSASNLMKRAYKALNSNPDEHWKSDMILELSDYMYGLATVV